MLGRELTTLATALMFLTRIPVGRHASGEPEVLARATQYFPLVGFIVALLIFSAYLLGTLIWPTEIALCMALVIAILLTGAFHEDGLADLADSAGAWTVEKRLSIMRDSRVGTYGSVALILSILISYVTLNHIAQLSALHLLLTLVLAHVLGRWSSLPLIYFGHYAREDSDNKVVAEAVNRHRLLVGTWISAVCVFGAVLILGAKPLIVVITSTLVIFLCHCWFKSKLGGITGDCLGAANKLTEISVYLTLATL